MTSFCLYLLIKYLISDYFLIKIKLINLFFINIWSEATRFCCEQKASLLKLTDLTVNELHKMHKNRSLHEKLFHADSYFSFESTLCPL